MEGKRRWPSAASTTLSCTCTVCSPPWTSTGRPSASRSGWRFPAAPRSCARRARPTTTTCHAPDQPEHPGLYHLAWEVGTLGDLVDARSRLLAAGALVGESDHRVSKSLYAKDPSGIEFEVLWRVPAEDWEAELADGGMTLPLDWDATLARWGRDQVTGAAAGSPT